MSFDKPRHSCSKFGSAATLQFLPVAALLLLSSVQTASALKHNYHTKNDERDVIGPIGFPFGFADTGFLNLTVYDFELSLGQGQRDDYANEDYESYLYDLNTRRSLKKKTNNNNEEPDITQAMDDIRAVGFLVKRFKDESEFTHFMNWLAEDPTRCAFQPFIDEYDLAGDDYLFSMGESEAQEDDDDDWRYNDGYGEILDDVGNTGIFLNMLPKTRWGPSAVFVSHEFSKGQEGLYFLIYQICPRPNVDIRSTFEVDFHFSNLDMFGNESYLPVGEMALPHMFFYFSLLYAICLFAWSSNIRLIGQGQPGHWSDVETSQNGPISPQQLPIVYPIHHLMTALLSLKFLSLFFESTRYHFLRVIGKAIFWSWLYYAFTFIKGTFLFTVILLIGSGWSFVKPFLSDREKQMICAVLGLQVVNNLAIVVLTQETEGEHAFDRWTAILHLVDILCCCAVLIPIVWHVNALEKNIEQSDDHGDDEEVIDLQGDTSIPEDEFETVPLDNVPDSRLVSKLKQFRSFYLLVVGYIYVTRIVVYIFATILDYRHTWMRHFVIEAVTLAFYVTVGIMFRPMCENPYLSVPKEDDHQTSVVAKEVELPRKSSKSKE